jgi:hypothetical protein
MYHMEKIELDQMKANHNTILGYTSELMDDLAVFSETLLAAGTFDSYADRTLSLASTVALLNHSLQQRSQCYQQLQRLELTPAGATDFLPGANAHGNATEGDGANVSATQEASSQLPPMVLMSQRVNEVMERVDGIFEQHDPSAVQADAARDEAVLQQSREYVRVATAVDRARVLAEQAANGENVAPAGAAAEPGDEDAEMVVVEGRTSLRCPITGTWLEDPVKNKECGHVYSRVAIVNQLNEYARMHRGSAPMKCPCAGCRKSVKRADLQDDAMTAVEVRRAQAQERGRRIVATQESIVL